MVGSLELIEDGSTLHSFNWPPVGGEFGACYKRATPRSCAGLEL